MGIYKANPSPDAASPFEPDPSLSMTSDRTTEEKDAPREKKGEITSNALLFLECACQLIIELAGG